MVKVPCYLIYIHVLVFIPITLIYIPLALYGKIILGVNIVNM